MASYFIIGGDQKEYGPISSDDIRQWITEGRLNGQSLAKSPSESAWRTLASFPEFADVLAAGTPPPIASLRASVHATPSTDYLGRDYELDMGSCISQGWGLVTNKMSVLLVAGLIYFGIQAAASMLGNIPVVGAFFSLAKFVIAGPLIGGLFYLSLRVIRSEPAEAGEVFAGFSKAFAQLFLATLVQSLLLGLCLLPYIIVFYMKANPMMGQFKEIVQQMQSGTPPSAESMDTLKSLLSIFIATLPILLVCLVPSTYLGVSWKFSLPLIMDKEMDFWTAMKVSFKMVNKHWWQVFGLTILVALLNVAGFFACCIGLVFTIPVGCAALMYAYETIYSARKN